MNQNKDATFISDCLHIARRYARSIRIERDLRDPESLDGYVITPTVQYALGQLMAGLRAGSTQRAWRLTGPYGAGKSAFGIFVANLLGRQGPGHQKALSGLSLVSQELASTASEVPRYLPIPVTGSRARFGDVLFSSLVHELEAERTAGRSPAIAAELKNFQWGVTDGQLEDGKAIELIADFAQYIKRSSLPYDGILILIDEMGKFLEYAAIRPNKTDAFLFQRLGELASGASDIPVAVIGFLHHRFADYAIGYGQRAEEEWAKVSERFEEIPFDESPEQYAFLLSSAIENDTSILSRRGLTEKARLLYREAQAIGVSVTSQRHEDLLAVSARLYPLHPATLVVLSSGIKRFGQNERSLFSFLLSHEPHAFQQYISTTPLHSDNWYRLSDLFDYLSSIGSLRFREGDRRRRWEHLQNALVSSADLTETEREILKTVGLINVLEPVQGLKADRSTVSFALRDEIENDEVFSALSSLTVKGVLYQRSSQKDFCLWSNTSIDLEALYEEAERRVSPVAELESFLTTLPQTRPVLAHRHYHRTGTLRAFEIHYIGLGKVEHEMTLGTSKGFDGQILVIPAGVGEDMDRAQEVLAQSELAKDPRVLLNLTEVTPADLSLARELRIWQWIQHTCQELRVDEFGRNEVKRRLDELTVELEQRLSSFLAFEDSPVWRKRYWLHQSRKLDIPDRKSLNQRLSDICDRLYSASPVIRNELINRSRLSSAAASARIRLIAAMIESQGSENLGLVGTPPEMAIYLSLFHASGLHRAEGGKIGFYPPTAEDPCNWRKVWYDLRELLKKRGEIRLDALFKILEEPPYGVRQGVSPLLLLAFMLHYRQDVSLFERGTYVVQMSEHHFMRLLKSPKTFSLNFLSAESGRESFLRGYWLRLGVLRNRFDRGPELTDVVRELFRWATNLSSFALETKDLSKTARAVRTAILKVSDPLDLVYSALPKACGTVIDFSRTEEHDPACLAFLGKLDSALRELDEADRKLRVLVRATLIETFQLGAEVVELRRNLRKNYLPYSETLGEPKLKALLARAADSSLSDEKWLDSMASLISGKILPHWKDETFEGFGSEIRILAGQLKRWIALMVSVAKDQPIPKHLASVIVTRSNGKEFSVPVLSSGKMSAKLESLKKQVKSVLRESDQDAAVVLAHLLAEIMEKSSRPVAKEK